MVDGTNFNLVILIDGNPAGMIELRRGVSFWVN